MSPTVATRSKREVDKKENPTEIVIPPSDSSQLDTEKEESPVKEVKAVVPATHACRNHHFYEAILNKNSELAAKIRDEYPMTLSFEIKSSRKGRSYAKRYVLSYNGKYAVKVLNGPGKTELVEFKDEDQLVLYLQKHVPETAGNSRKIRVKLRALVYETPVEQDTEFPLHDAEEVFFQLGEYHSNAATPFIDLLARTYYNALSQIKYWHWEHEDTFQLELSKDLYLHLQKNPTTGKWDLFIVSYALLNSFFIIGIADKKFWSTFDFKAFNLYQWHRLDDQGLWKNKGVENAVNQDAVFKIIKGLK